MLRAMRRLRRWLFLAFLLLGSLIAWDQGGLHGNARAPDSKATKAPKSKTEEPSKQGRTYKPASFVGPFASPAACAEALRARASRVASKPNAAARIATWNVRWFPRGTPDGRDPTLRTNLDWLACAIALLDADVIALQEILDDIDARAAAVDLTTKLDALTKGSWTLELDDCTGGTRQHVGLLWNRKRATVEKVRSIGALNPAGSACASGLRPGLGAHVRFADGQDANVVVLHLDSGQTARDFDHRAESVRAFEAALAPLRARDPDVIVLGDYNTMGCDRCQPQVSVEQEVATLDALLASAALKRVVPQSNACSHYYRRRAGMLDHIAVGSALQAHAQVESHGICAALACKTPPRGEHPLAWDALSDHCPLVLEVSSRATRASANKQRASVKN